MLSGKSSLYQSIQSFLLSLFNSNEIKYEIELPSRPLCMDFHGNYLALGLMNGKISLYNAITGDHLFDFQAHYDKVNQLPIKFL